MCCIPLKRVHAVYVVAKWYCVGVPSSRSRCSSEVQKTAFSAWLHPGMVIPVISNGLCAFFFLSSYWQARGGLVSVVTSQVCSRSDVASVEQLTSHVSRHLHGPGDPHTGLWRMPLRQISSSYACWAAVSRSHNSSYAWSHTAVPCDKLTPLREMCLLFV